MGNELENTSKTTETDTNKNSEQATVDLKELQAKVKALEAENGKLKQSVTNASADASKWKQTAKEKDDALKAKMSDEERAKQEQDEANAALRQRVAELETAANIATINAALVASDIGMDAGTADKVAKAMNAGETDKVLDGIRQFVKAHDKALRESALQNNQTLPGGSSDKTVSREEFDKMSLSEMMAFKVQHPDLYAEYIK